MEPHSITTSMSFHQNLHKQSDLPNVSVSRAMKKHVLICLFVCLQAGLHKMLLTDLHDHSTRGGAILKIILNQIPIWTWI